jgi:MFS family permease
MRGRYMSIYGLTWGIAAGIGPVFGGLLNDHIGPTATWHGGLVVGVVAAAMFTVLGFRYANTLNTSTSPANLPEQADLPG